MAKYKGQRYEIIKHYSDSRYFGRLLIPWGKHDDYQETRGYRTRRDALKAVKLLIDYFKEHGKYMDAPWEHGI